MAATRPKIAPDSTKEALKALVRSLARAAAIEDYRQRNGGDGTNESGDLRAV